MNIPLHRQTIKDGMTPSDRSIKDSDDLVRSHYKKGPTKHLEANLTVGTIDGNYSE